MAFFRRIVEDYEARLASPETTADRSQASGKAEHERFEDGEVQFEVRGRGFELADGTELEIRLNGLVVARAAAKRGGISLRLSNRKGHTIPTVQAGDRLEIAYLGEVLLLGCFDPD
jgi:hypothetical protein